MKRNCRLIINIQSNIIENYISFDDFNDLDYDHVFGDILMFNNIRYIYNLFTEKFEQWYVS